MSDSQHDTFPSSALEAALEAAARRHTPAEDIYAALIGCSFVAVGVLLLQKAGLVTGGIAGVALILSYLFHVTPTTILLVINLPFFVYAGRAVGVVFAIKSTLSSIGVMVLGLFLPEWLAVTQIQPVFAALFAGSLIGMGILALARHGAGVGGIGVIALHFHKARGWNAGRTQMMFDCVILACSLPVIGPGRFALSILSAAAINTVMFINHRPGRYIGH